MLHASLMAPPLPHRTSYVSLESHNSQLDHPANNWRTSQFIKIYNIFKTIYNMVYILQDRLCGLVVRVPGYRSRGPRFDSRRYQIFWEVVGLERGHSASWG
jgi:hypothetical protein